MGRPRAPAIPIELAGE